VSLYVALDGVPVIHGAIVLPFSGIWMADLVLSEPKDLTGPQVLTIADESYKCTPVRAVNFSGARGTRVVGGAAGWRKVIGPRQYSSTVMLGTVLRDAANAVGEQIAVDVDRQIGTNYIRSQGPATMALNALLGASWWMDPAGVVQTKARTVTPIVGDFTAMRVTGASGIWEIATEGVADWTPGRSFSGPTSSGVISRVEHKIAKGKLRTLVMST
jgi:hypothetical protein